MSPFSATQAAFAGLRLARREPLTILVWALLLLAIAVVTGALMAATVGPELMQLRAVQPAPGGLAADPMRMMAVMSRLAPIYGLVSILSLAVYGVMFAAVNRAVLRPQAGSRFGRLALGVDELLQLAVLILIGLTLLAVYIVGLLGLILAIAVAALLAKASGVEAVTIVIVFLAAAALVGLLIYVMVRLSLASPLALDRRQLDFKAAWRMTRGRFWPLLGAYVLAWFIAVVLTLVALVAFTALAFGLGGGLSAAAVALRPDMSSVGAFFGGAMIPWLVLASAVNGLAIATMLGAPADAYLQLRDGPGAPAARAVPTAADRSTAFGSGG